MISPAHAYSYLTQLDPTSARRFRQFLEKLLGHHFGRSVDQALANRRDRAPYLRVSTSWE
jgi:hypothetical protein